MNKIVIDREKIVTLKENTYELEIEAEDVILAIEGNVIIEEIKKKEENLKLTIILKENANLLYNRFMYYSKANTFIKLEQDNNTKAILNYSFLTNGECKINVDPLLKGNYNNTEINIKAVTQNKGNVIAEVTAEVGENTKENHFLEDIHILLTNEEESVIIPNLLVSSSEVEVNHAATISGINIDDLFYLKTKGLTEKKATELIKSGFLIGNLDIKDQEKRKIKEILGGE